MNRATLRMNTGGRSLATLVEITMKESRGFPSPDLTKLLSGESVPMRQIYTLTHAQ